VGATVLLDGGATRGALTTTLPPGVDPASIGGGPECVRSEDVLYSPIATLLLTLRSITPAAAADCNAPFVVASAGRGGGTLLRGGGALLRGGGALLRGGGALPRGVSQFATIGAATTL
jgi:hypothetical protein